MKRKMIDHSILIVVMTMAVLTSCKKSSSATEDIVGTWTAGTTSLTIMVGTKTLTQYFVDTYGITAEAAQVYSAAVEQSTKQEFAGTIKVNSNNTYTSTLGGKTETGTWSLSSDKTKLTVTPSNDTPTTFDVVELTSSKLHINITETTTEDLNSDGTPETITVQADVSFSK